MPAQEATLIDLAQTLSLDPEDLQALRRQGSVSCELRATGYVYKLRFRREGRQQVRWLGSDSSLGDLVGHALTAWQHARRGELRLRRVLANVRRWRRAIKEKLSPAAAQAGLSFHGLMLRRRRSASTFIPTSDQELS